MDLNELTTGAFVVDIVIMVVSFVSIIVVSIGWASSGISAEGRSNDEKIDGRQAVASQITVSLTATSILLAASFVVLQIGNSPGNQMSDAAVTQVLLAAVSLGVSLAFAVWNSALIVPLSRSLDVSVNAPTAMISAISLFSLLAGAGLFAVALFLI